jgi:hypothetical protein
MQIQITKAFAELDAQLYTRQRAWFEARSIELRTYYKSEERTKAYESLRHMPRKQAEPIRIELEEKLLGIAGGKAWMELIWLTPTKESRDAAIAKNINATIARRDAQIIKALQKAGINEIPDFALTHNSDGFEGFFKVANHSVTIRTILAGGYNIQCLHQRTLVKVKPAK